MNPSLDKRYAEQQAKILILERENDFLSQKAEENQLLSKTFEEINSYEKTELLFDNILESISILLDIQYAGIFEQRNNKFVNIAGYALFDSRDAVKATFEIPEKTQKKLFSCQSYFIENSNNCCFYYPDSNFVAIELLIVPLCAKPEANKVFVFANNAKSILQKRTTLLEKIAKISSLKIERLYYQSELKNLNKDLEKRVETRTQELSFLNEKLLKEIEQKNKTELELKKSEAKFKAIFEHSPLGLFYYNNKGVILNCNNNFVNIIGSTKKALIGLDMINRLPDKKLIKALKKSLVAGTGIYKGYYKSLTGAKITPVRVIFGGIKNKNKKIVGGIGIVEDITVQKQHEDEINAANEELKATTDALKESNLELNNSLRNTKENEERFRAFSEQASEGITVADASGNYVFVNPAFCKMSGYSEKELLKISVFDMKSKDQDPKIFHESKSNLEGIPVRVNLQKKNGTEYIAEVIGTKIKIDKQILVLGTVRDITENIKAEQNLIIAKEKAEESNRLKTEFLNNMSHEIRTPMNGILGFSKLLNTLNLSDEKRKLYTNIIINSSNQLMRIIDDILEISRLGTKQVNVQNKKVCLNDLLLELFTVFNVKTKEKNIAFYLKNALSDKESIILTDQSKLNKILDNLLENALKFTSVGSVELGYTILKKNKKKYLQLYVKDTGVGVATENHELIFERFLQVEKKMSQKAGGLGLGLSIAKENTELLGGTITLKSEKGKGASFFVTIPYKPVK